MNSKNSRGEVLQIKVSDLNSQGQGVGHDANGKVCFIAGALPGETVEAEVEISKKNYSTAKVQQILHPSPDRIDAPCTHFGDCGGCDVQHLQYSAQLQFKKKRVIDAFKKFAILDLTSFDFDCEGSKLEWRYRNKSQMPYRKLKDGRNRLGMFRRGSHELIPIKECLIQEEASERVFRWLDDHAKLKAYNERTGKGLLRNVMIRSIPGSVSFMVILVVQETNAQLETLAKQLFQEFPDVVSVYANIQKEKSNRVLGYVYTLLAGDAFLSGEFMGLKISLHPEAFLQINNETSKRIYDYALSIADLQSEDIALDLYCGIGLLTNLIAQKVKHCTGIEIVNSAIQTATQIAKTNSISNTAFLSGDVQAHIETLNGATLLFLDPPRKGCDPEVLESIAKSDVDRLVYISCDPATLARDIALLSEIGRYKVAQIRSFDMFPQTMHVETVCFLTR